MAAQPLPALLALSKLQRRVPPSRWDGPFIVIPADRVTARGCLDATAMGVHLIQVG